MSTQMWAGGPAHNFAERAAQLLERVEYRRIETVADLEQILRLRYDAYLREGAIVPNAQKQLVDAFDDLENAYTFGVFIDDELASSFRVNVLAGEFRKSPAAEAFPDFFEPALEAGQTFVDGNRFVANYEMARRFPELPYLTVRIPYMAAVHFRSQYIAASVRAEHQAFYVRGFGLYSVRAPRAYPTLTKPLGLMMVNFAEGGKEYIEKRHPYYASSVDERWRLFRTKTHRRVSTRTGRTDDRKFCVSLPRLFSRQDRHGRVGACGFPMPLTPSA
ncbi:MAG: hypothetical protein QOC72_3736 [Methylobacteriaceae bacterium]|nr:hypothetical protein [Methylobacteriaceae bacterium]